MRIVGALATFAVGLACGAASGFVCEDDGQCMNGAIAGVCQPSGSCSFPDDECPSGQRYGEHAATGLVGICVPPGGDGSGSGDGDDASSVTATDDGDDGLPSPDGGPTSSSAVDDTSGTGPVAMDDSTSGDGSSSGGEEIDPDLVLWLTFEDRGDPFADASLYAREVSCDRAMDGCPTSAGDGTSTFDGIDDHLQVTHDPALETDMGLTVSARVRNDALSDFVIHTVVARPYGVATENSWELFFRDENADGTNDVVFEIADPSNGQIQLIAPAPATKGEWTRLTATWTSGSTTLWFDGVMQASAGTSGMLLDDNSIFVGADLDDTAVQNWYEGAIDDLRVYRRVLTDTEIAALR